MKSTYLLPYRFKKLSFIIFITSLLTLIISMMIDWTPNSFKVPVFAIISQEILQDSIYFEWIESNVWYDLLCLLIIVFGIVFAFSEEKIEDEYISNLRLRSLVKAVYCNYAILILAIIFIYNLSFFTVLLLNMLSTLLLFILIFQKELILVRKRKS